MKTGRVAGITRSVLILVLVLAFLSWDCSAASAASINEQLMRAAANGDIRQVKDLLGKGADPNAQFKHGSTTLVSAASRGHPEVVKLLIEGGAGVSARQKDGCTPLMFAAEKGHLEVVKLLAEKGADVNASGKDGRTALMAAARRGQLQVVKLLLWKNIEIWWKNFENSSKRSSRAPIPRSARS